MSGSFAAEARAILAKEICVELRRRAAINAILLFSVTALVLVAYATGVGELSVDSQAAILWVILTFAAFSGLSHVFVHEEEAGTSLALRLTASPSAIFAGKLAFNILLSAAISALLTPAYVVMLGVKVVLPWAFAAEVALGSVCLASAATVVAALLARAQGRGALFGALGFPLLIPLLVLAVYGTRLTLEAGTNTAELWRSLVGLAAYSAMMITASALLFPVIWEE